MRTALTVAASVLLVVALTRTSHAEANKACISKVAEALPRIAGLVVKASRTRPVSPAVLATWKGQTRPIMVDVDVTTPGAELETYSYMCVITQGSAFVQRTKF
jgi:hypothetical protein